MFLRVLVVRVQDLRAGRSQATVHAALSRLDAHLFSQRALHVTRILFWSNQCSLRALMLNPHEHHRHFRAIVPISQLVAVAGCGDEVNATSGVLLAHIIVWRSRKTKLLNLHCLEPKMYMDDVSSNLPVRIVGNLDDAALAQLQTLPPMTR